MKKTAFETPYPGAWRGPDRAISESEVAALGIGKKDLVRQEAVGLPLFVVLPARAGVFGIPEANARWPYLGMMYHEERFTPFYDRDGQREAFAKMVSKELETPGWWEARYAEYQANESLYLQACFALLEASFSDFSEQELAERLEAFYDATFEIERWGLRQEEIIVGTDDLILKAKASDPELAAMFQDLLLPSEANYLQIQESELAELGIAAGSEQEWDAYAKKYSWVRSNYSRGSVLSADDFRKELEQMGSGPDAYRAHKDHLNELIESIRAKQEKAWPVVRERTDDETFAGLRLGNLYALWRDRRKRANLVWSAVIEKFVHEISRRRETDPLRAKRLLPEDFLAYMTDASALDRFEDAHPGPIAVIDLPDGKGTFSGEAYEHLTAAHEPDERHDGKPLKGIPAAPGTAEGPVAIVLDPDKDATKMKKGAVLVTSSTRPDFLPLMRRAAAIVTDEGGMLAHAAIVSRELKIPCAVGTKTATKALKDGDIVRVDGTAGTAELV